MLGFCAFPLLCVCTCDEEGGGGQLELMCNAINSMDGVSLLVLTCSQFEVSAAAASPQQSPGDSPCLACQPAQLVQT